VPREMMLSRLLDNQDRLRRDEHQWVSRPDSEIFSG
jgi:hypothetical protein